MTPMIKILIVDDEPFVRSLIKGSIDLSDTTLNIIGDVSSGAEALDIIAVNKPDIILTDINMPIMDGFELSKRALDVYPEIKIIIVSGYQDFIYAKQGIHLGVVGYVTKPIQVDELNRLINESKNQILSDRDMSKNIAIMESEILQHKVYLKNNFLNKLVKGSLTLEQIRRLSLFYKVPLNYGQLEIMILELTYADNIDEATTIITNFSACNLITELYPQLEDIHSFQDDFNRIVVLSTNKTIDLSTLSETVTRVLKERLSLTLHLGLSARHTFESGTINAYQEALIALKYSINTDESSIMYSNEVSIDENENFHGLADKINHLIFFIRAGLVSKLNEELDVFFQPLLHIDHNNFLIIAHSVIQSVTQILVTTGLKSTGAFEYQYDLLHKIQNASNNSEIILLVKEYLVDHTDQIASKKTNQANVLVIQTKDYIADHFKDAELNLNHISSELHINSNYLSRIFKQDTKLGFRQYLLEIRMKEALRLLNTSNKRAYEIASDVGYMDPNYFSICFKKYYGISFTDYTRQDI